MDWQRKRRCKHVMLEPSELEEYILFKATDRPSRYTTTRLIRSLPLIMMAHSRCTPIILRSLRVQANRHLCPIPTSFHFSFPVSHSPFPRYFLVPEHLWC